MLDPNLTIAPGWVRAWFGPLTDLCTVTQTLEDGVPSVRCIVAPGDSNWFAWRIAVGIAARKLAPRPDLFCEWLGASTGCGEHAVPQDHIDRMIGRGLLVNVGTPGHGSHDNHFYGLVGEAVLHELVGAGCHGLGTPVRVEGHDWSVTDTGGDQLSIYTEAGGFVFRLWESKARYGATSLTTIVSGAASQLDGKAEGYLSRFSVAESRAATDPELANFIAAMPDLWVDNDARAGVGVGVTTHAAPPASTPFAQLSGHFNVPNSSKCGHLALLGPLGPYRTAISQTLWKGVGLWTVP